jgi:hypothetical protein
MWMIKAEALLAAFGKCIRQPRTLLGLPGSIRDLLKVGRKSIGKHLKFLRLICGGHYYWQCRSYLHRRYRENIPENTPEALMT